MAFRHILPHMLSAMVAAGHSRAEMAAEFGCSVSCISKRMAAAGIRMKKPRIKVIRAGQEVAQAVPSAARAWFEV